jgi:hypothetical protein
MSEPLRALTISGGILLVVLVLAIVVSIAAVKRGTVAMQQQRKLDGKGRN